ncbi:class I SAM-dependent methyltransferase [Candidatus Micrarchaeota archaeon]|nr:class I SAM-dependent methyltransferase [Candidatus Micrarchaeota archaeon]
MMDTVLSKILKLVVRTPAYPYWLEEYKKRKAYEHLLTDISGKVLEVGAGDGSRKIELLRRCPAIKKYEATDYSSWDGEFEKINGWINKYGTLAEVSLGFKKRKLDRVCSATNLPYKDNSFDYHLSFSVLEHIADPEKYFSEAARVVKKGGYILVSVPFLYRIHGGEPEHRLDYFRYAHGFFHEMAERNGLKLTEIYINGGFGTSFASLTNQYLIRRIFESNSLVRIPLLLVSPFVFVSTNALGFILDLKPDKRFPTNIHVKFQKLGKR